MADLKRSFFSGRITKIGEVRTFERNGKENYVVDFTIACNGRGKDSEAEFFPCTVFGPQAKYVADYGYAGREITVIGEPCMKKYTDNDGKNHYNYYTLVDSLKLHGAKKTTDSSTDTADEQEVVEISEVDELPY